MQTKLAVVILHYGKPELTSRLHNQLLKSDPKWDALYVLDNNAPSPYRDSWKRLDKNMYWAGALAYTVDTMRAMHFSHLWFLNNDIYFIRNRSILESAWGRLRRMEKTLGEIGVYSPSALKNPYHPQMVRNERYQYRRVTCVDGIAPLFNLNCIRALGGIDYRDNAYGYGVDVAVSLLAHRSGWPVVVDHQVAIKHVYHSTARTIDGFLSKAAQAEETYMRRVLGNGWRDVVKREQRLFTEHESM